MSKTMLATLISMVLLSTCFASAPVLATSEIQGYYDLQFKLTSADSSHSYVVVKTPSDEPTVFPTLNSPITITIEYISLWAVLYTNGTRVELTPTWVESVQVWFNNASFQAPRTIKNVEFKIGNATYPFYYIPEGREMKGGSSYIVSYELQLDPRALLSPSIRSWTNDFQLPTGVWGFSIHTEVAGYYGNEYSGPISTGPTITAYFFLDLPSPVDKATKLSQLPYGGTINIPEPLATPVFLGLNVVELFIAGGSVAGSFYAGMMFNAHRHRRQNQRRRK